MRIKALLTAVIVMGVLIVLGIATLVVTIVRRLAVTPPAQSSVLLDEPVGTRMLSVGGSGDRLAILLQGGGPDRVVLLDPRTGQVVGRLGLAR